MQDILNYQDKIKRVHSFKNSIPFFKFDYSLNPYYGYWYAQDELYLIHDCMMDGYYFINAKSPKEAIDKMNKRIDEATHAGEMYFEEGDF